MSIASQTETDLRPRGSLGISSFALGTISTLSFMLVCGYVTVFKAAASSNAMIGEILVLIWIVNLIGIGLGIAGATRRLSSDIFPILGLTLNFGILTISVALIEIGSRLQ